MPLSGVLPPRTVFVTPIVFIVTALVSVTAILHPQWTLLLRRDEPAWAAGQLWRILTPVLVQPDGWGQLAFNLAGIAILGTAAELRGLSWLASYAFPAVASICVMYVAAPADRGGGSSDGVAGLIAALAVVNVARPGGSTRLTEQLARGYSAFFVSYVAVLSRATEWVAAVFGNVVMIFILTSSRAWGTAFTNRLLLALVCVSVPILLVRGNSHGVGLLAGLIAAAFRFRRKGSR